MHAKKIWQNQYPFIKKNQQTRMKEDINLIKGIYEKLTANIMPTIVRYSLHWKVYNMTQLVFFFFLDSTLFGKIQKVITNSYPPMSSLKAVLQRQKLWLGGHLSSISFTSGSWWPSGQASRSRLSETIEESKGNSHFKDTEAAHPSFSHPPPCTLPANR